MLVAGSNIRGGLVCLSMCMYVVVLGVWSVYI